MPLQKSMFMDFSEVHVWFKFLSFQQIILLYIIQGFG